VSTLLANPASTRLRAGAHARRVPAWTVTAVLGLAYVIAAPPSSDLAAASYRSELFGRAGFTLWDNGWYAGHHLPAYSVLAPALGWLIGPLALAAVSMTVAAALFAVLIDGRFPAPAVRVATLWFALGAAIALLASRVPFDLGLAIGLGALVLAQRGRRASPLGLAVVCSLTSPVAGAFLALAALAWALGGRARRFALALMAASLVPIAALAVAFPEGGSQPFVASAFYPDLLGVLIIFAAIQPEYRVLRIGTLLYAAALIGSYAIPTAVGGNVDRLGALLAGPIAACVLAGRSGARRALLIVLAPFLLYWQANAPVADFASAAADPAVHASYYTPLLAELRALGVGYSARPARIEVVPTRDHWEARFVAPHVAIARGWERQLDTGRNGLFYGSAPLTPARYSAWLSEQAIAYVALPDAPLDYSGQAEGRLLRGSELTAGSVAGAGVRAAPARVLEEVWRSAHWRLFAVSAARPLAEAPAVMTRMGGDSFTLAAPRAGRFLVRVRFTPYWALSRGRGCVREAPGGWTELEAARAGSLNVVIDFSLARVFGHGPRCR
jgi:hypothetical protein